MALRATLREQLGQLDALTVDELLEQRYRRLMAHWHTVMPGRILDVSYNELVHDPETRMQEILAFCKLPFEPGCADLARNRTPVATLSSAQSRRPINDRSIGEWRRYQKQLDWMQAALADSG